MIWAGKGSAIPTPPKVTYTEIVDSTSISDDDTFIIINYRVYQPWSKEAGTGYYLDIETDSPFDFAKLRIFDVEWDTTLGATIISFYSSVEYDDLEVVIYADGTILESSDTYCKRIAGPRTRWELYSRS